MVIQNQVFLSPLPSSIAKFGNTLEAFNLSGAQALATIVAMLPSTCAQMSVKVMWNRVRVCNRIMPNPTPCTASRTPSQSQSVRPTKAPAMGEPAHGTHSPIPEVPHSIWHHRGAPSPTAKIGRIQEWEVERVPKMIRKAAQTKTKKKTTKIATAQAGACLLDQRYSQLRP